MAINRLFLPLCGNRGHGKHVFNARLEMKQTLSNTIAPADCSMENKYSARCHGNDREHIHTNGEEARPRGCTPTHLSPLSSHKHHVQMRRNCACGCESHVDMHVCHRRCVCSVNMTGSREGKILDSFLLRRLWTYCHGGDGGDERVDDNGRRLAVVLRSWVRLGVSFVKTEESLDVHWERVGVLKVVCQQNGPCHDDQLEIKHIGSSFRIESTGECRSWERRDSQREQGGKILSRMMKNKKRDVSSTGQHDGCFLKCVK